MTDMSILMLVGLAKELGQKNNLTNLVTWDVSDFLTLCVDIQNEKVFYRTKPGGVAIQDKVTLDDILITTAAIRFALENSSDKFTTQIDLYYQQGVRYYANLAVMAKKNHKDGRFVLVGPYIAFKNRSGFNVYEHVQNGPGVWYQAAGTSFNVKIIKRVQQKNNRRDREVFNLLREYVKKL